MKTFEAFTMALGNLRTNIMRTILTLLGIVIGIAAVITILTLGRALELEAARSFESAFGSGLQVRVKPQATPEEIEANDGLDPYEYWYGSTLDDPDAALSEEILDNILTIFDERVKTIAVGDMFNSIQVSVDNGRETVDSGLIGVNRGFFTAQNSTLVAGRFMTEHEVAAARPVAVVSYKLADQLTTGFPPDILGTTVTVENDTGFEDLEVVGVLKKVESSLTGMPDQAQIFAPYLFEPRFNQFVDGSFVSVRVVPSDNKDRQALRDELQGYLNRIYDDIPGYHAVVEDNAEFAEDALGFYQTISLVIAAIASISLLVGGIGVMNIMLITVTERTREIGVRKALGARRSDIRRQFLTEALVVCSLGGTIGIILGAAAGMIASSSFGAFALPPLYGVVGSLAFCMAIGVFFGWYPANKAAKLDPIEALRYE